MSEDQIPRAWRQGIQRAIDRKLKAVKCADGHFRVKSGSSDAQYHLHLDAQGKVGPCTCQASERFGADYPWAHRWAVARALCALRGIRIEQAPAVLAVESAGRRSQVFRAEVAA